MLPSSSIIKKVVMAATGVLLIGFLISHLAANCLMFAGPDMYNEYSHKLVSNPLIYVAEAGLLLLFGYHIVLGIIVTLKNRSARPKSYAVSNSLGERSLASSTMIISGGLILVFLVVHLWTFKFGTDVAPPSEDGVRNLYALVVTRFQSPIYSIFYILCMAVLGLHLSHAIQSSCRTFGISHPLYLGHIRRISYVLAVGFAVGFSIFPIYFGFIK